MKRKKNSQSHTVKKKGVWENIIFLKNFLWNVDGKQCKVNEEVVNVIFIVLLLKIHNKK